MTIDAAFGTPNERVTHWGISRVTGRFRNPRGKLTPNYDRLTFDRGDKLQINEWPLQELTLENIRERWGDGEFRTHWFIHDPHAPEPSDRRASGGNGLLFVLDPEDEAPVPAAVPVGPPAFLSNNDPMSSALNFAKDLMGLADARTQHMIGMVRRSDAGDGGGGSAEILAKIAGLEAKIEADKREREIEERHRAELAKKDTEIAELKRAAEKAEDEAARASDSPTFEAGTPILEQLPTLAANTLTGIASKNPELAMGIVSKALEFFKTMKQAPAATVSRETVAVAPPPSSGVAPVRVMRPQGAVHVVRPVPSAVPPPPVEDDELTPARTRPAADPAPVPPPPAAAAESAE